MSLREAIGSEQIENEMRANFAEIASKAVGVAVQRPDSSPNALENERSSLMGSIDGSVREEKMQILSRVERTGGAPRTDQVDHSDSSEVLEERVRSLYFELTNYQVAWKIAQRMQQDTSQLLRGQ
ncbi:hypothetical protein [Sulfitobacter sp. 20_GPM-1509m]|uniref:hypothetical protein n=1 Tax=Sulfitobacter sp. 20_GPM-1509m TaxID=1380367 RepID=UPI00048B1DAB|nr:hypothetical protein [Sulfitobacter sp. 20_GPM-1509m]